MGKSVNHYLGAFLVGGIFTAVSHVICMVYRALNVPEIIVVSVTVFTLAAFGAITTATGHYQRILNIGAMGAMIPMSGFSSAIADATLAARRRGGSVGKILLSGVADGFKILFSAYLLSAVIAAILYMMR